MPTFRQIWVMALVFWIVWIPGGALLHILGVDDPIPLLVNFWFMAILAGAACDVVLSFVRWVRKWRRTIKQVPFPSHEA